MIHTLAVFLLWRESIITTGKKKDTVVCLAGARSLLRLEKKFLVICLAGPRSLLRPEKKSSSCLSGGCAIVITTGKKVLVVCLAGARSKNNDPCQDMKPGPQGKLMYYYFFFHGSNLREIIQFLSKIECIEFECNEFVLVLVQIDLIHFEHSICISST